VDDYQTFVTNDTIPFSGFLTSGQTSDQWAFLSGLSVEGGSKYYFNYFSANITEPRDTQSANLMLYDFYERHMEKIELNLNQSLIVFLFKSDNMVVEEFDRIKEYGKKF